jgi:cytochrome c peroxidase
MPTSARRWATAALVLISLGLREIEAASAQGFEWKLPPGFPVPRVAADNPMSPEKVELGRFLFYDKRLSGNRTQSCSSCHRQELAFTDALTVAIGSTGEHHPRNSQSLTNVAYAPRLAWANPILFRLEDQALIPIFGEMPVELGLAGREDELLARLGADPRYRRMFAAAFPEESQPISIASVVRAIASFVRTLISGNSPYDRYALRGDDNAISPSAIRGAELFNTERLECFHCHGGFNFAGAFDAEGRPLEEAFFFNNGLYNIGGRGDYPAPNRGIFEFTGRRADMGHFKAPTLRNIALTAPYMHDGSIATLDEVLDHYAAGGRTITDGPYAGDGSQSPFKDRFFLRGFVLNEQEREDLLNFFDSLTDEEFVTNPAFSDPFTNLQCTGDCDGDTVVAIDELMTGIGIALGHKSLDACPEFDADEDGDVGVAELVQGVQATVQGCPL